MAQHASICKYKVFAYDFQTPGKHQVGVAVPCKASMGNMEGRDSISGAPHISELWALLRDSTSVTKVE